MTRLLQHWFHADQTVFIVVLRNPYAGFPELWFHEELYSAVPFCDDCGERALKHWLYVHETLFEDLKYIKHRVVMQFERFALGDTQGLLRVLHWNDHESHDFACLGQLDAVLKHFSIDPVVKIEFKMPQSPNAFGRRERREFHGDPTKVTFNKERVHKWMAKFESMVMAQCNVTCNAVFDKYETAVNRYGYSLKNMKRVVPTPFLREFMLPATLPE